MTHSRLTAPTLLAPLAFALASGAAAQEEELRDADWERGHSTDSGAQLDDSQGLGGQPYERGPTLGAEDWYDPGGWTDGFGEDELGDARYRGGVDEDPWYADFWYDAEYRSDFEGVEYYREYDLYEDYYGSPRLRNRDRVEMNWDEPARTGGERVAERRRAPGRRGIRADRSVEAAWRGPVRVPQGAPWSKLEGRLASFASVEREGAADRRTIVRFELQDGRSRLVDLGPRLDTTDLNLQPGDSIAIYGRRGSLGDDRILVAGRVTVDGRTWRYLQPEQLGARLRATLARVERARLRGLGGRHELARLELEDGRSLLVDLARANAGIQDLPLHQPVTLHGRWAQHRGQRVFLVRRVEQR